YLGSDRSFSGSELSAEVWKDLWPIERRRQREFFCFGMDVLLKLDLPATRRFFDAFFNLEPRYWHGFLSSRLFLPELVLFGLSLFSHASNPSRVMRLYSIGSLKWNPRKIPTLHQLQQGKLIGVCNSSPGPESLRT
ncbi:hypothetical protein D5086_028900, partial [Populus alba]